MWEIFQTRRLDLHAVDVSHINGLEVREKHGIDPTGTYHGDSDLQLERIKYVALAIATPHRC